MTQPSFIHLINNRKKLPYCVLLWHDYIKGHITKEDLILELEKINENKVADYLKK